MKTIEPRGDAEWAERSSFIKDKELHGSHDGLRPGRFCQSATACVNTCIEMAKGCWPLTARRVLWILVFCGFAVNYMIRLNINIAIVAMIQMPRRTIGGPDVSVIGECARLEASRIANASLLAELTSLGTEELTTPYALSRAPPPPPTASVPEPGSNTTQLEDPVPEGFEWDERQQGLVLGAYFWLHWALQVPGGVLARKYGTKLVFGMANLVPVLLCLVTPMAAYWDYRALLFLRLLQGLIAGMAWPSMHNMTARWIPPNERSNFVTAYLGSSVGAALTFPLCGQLIHAWGWESAFYVCGVLGLLWYMCWFFMVFDTPAKHPRISSEERLYIASALGKTVSDDQMATPWRAILTSRAVWMNIVAQWGAVYGLFTLITQAPTYFRYIHGWNIRMTGLLSGMPHLVRILWAYAFSILGDFLLNANLMSRTNVRKLATFFCDVAQGLMLICLMFSGCNASIAIVFLTAATAANGSISTGTLASTVDISPNFASVVLGICGMISVIPGFISPIIVGQLTFRNQTTEQWQKVYGIAAAQLIFCGMLYTFFGQSELQPWNSSQKPRLSIPELRQEELKPLKKKHDEITRTS